MKYTLYVEMSFDTQEETVDLLNSIEGIKVKAFNPSGQEKVKLDLKTELWETYHDEDPPSPCVQLDRVDFDNDEQHIHEPSGVAPSGVE